jgi:hypothetical protein
MLSGCFLGLMLICYKREKYYFISEKIGLILAENGGLLKSTVSDYITGHIARHAVHAQACVIFCATYICGCFSTIPS